MRGSMSMAVEESTVGEPVDAAAAAADDGVEVPVSIEQSSVSIRQLLLA